MGDDLPIVLGRLAVISLASLLCAWFVLGASQAHDLSGATAIVQSSGSLSAGQAAHVSSLLTSASTLNPDRMVDLLRGLVALDHGQRSRAIGILERVVSEEPMNLEGWVYLAQAGLGDRALVQRAVVQIGILDAQTKGRR